MKSEKARSVFGCGSVIVIILAIAFVIVSQLDFFKSAHPQLSAWIALIAVISVPSFFVITGIVTDDKAQKSRKIRNICIYFGIVVVFVIAVICISKFLPKTAKQIDNFIEENDRKYIVHSTPDSSVFTQIAYERTEHILVVSFRDSDDAYYYYDVPYDVWKDFKASDSLGSYYNKNIKEKYEYEKIE